MMRRIIHQSHGHEIENLKFQSSEAVPCLACSQGKLIIKPSKLKVDSEAPGFLERIQFDICGPIYPSSDQFGTLWY